MLQSPRSWEAGPSPDRMCEACQEGQTNQPRKTLDVREEHGSGSAPSRPLSPLSRRQPFGPTTPNTSPKRRTEPAAGVRHLVAKFEEAWEGRQALAGQLRSTAPRVEEQPSITSNDALNTFSKLEEQVQEQPASRADGSFWLQQGLEEVVKELDVVRLELVEARSADAKEVAWLQDQIRSMQGSNPEQLSNQQALELNHLLYMAAERVRAAAELRRIRRGGSPRSVTSGREKLVTGVSLDAMRASLGRLRKGTSGKW